MKNKLLLALASLIFGMTVFTTGAYADKTSSMPGQTQSRWCSSEGMNAFEPNCAANITEREGKAAYGEPREAKVMPSGVRPQFCSTEGRNAFEPDC